MTKPIYVRDDDTCGPAALQIIEDMARAFKSHASIAKVLGISTKKFKNMLERQKGENAERLAWESGHADFEQEIIDRAKAMAMGSLVEEPKLDAMGVPMVDEHGKPIMEKIRVLSKAETIAFIYFTKSRLGWQEKDNTTTFQDNRINITLPAPISAEEMFARLGLSGPLDFRKIKDVTPGVAGEVEATKEFQLPKPMGEPT